MTRLREEKLSSSRVSFWMRSLVLVQVLSLLLTPKVHAAGCFKTVFAFGDGILDTGAISGAFPSILNYDYPPYGSTYFGKPSGRFSDGRLVLDFVTESLGLPKIPSYLRSVIADYSSGVSFAAAFSTISTVSGTTTAGPFMFLSPFALGVQLLQYLEFRTTTGSVIAKANNISTHKRSALELDSPAARLPANADFNTGLYLVAIGAHDIVNLYNTGHDNKQIESKFPALLSSYSLVIRSFAKLYGVKNIVVFDIEPLGCQPFLLTLIEHTDNDVDEKGCLIAVNALVQKFNAMLKSSVESWRSSYKSNIYFLSQYDIKIDLMKDAASGFSKTNIACCGVPASPYNILAPVPCGPSVYDPTTGNVTMATACSEPSSYLYWDGMYTTEAANKYITQKILSGAYFDIPFNTLTSCATNPLS